MGEPRLLADVGVSSREAEVLTLVGEHLTNSEISSRLYISVRTVESHVSSLLRKLGVADRRALADVAIERQAATTAGAERPVVPRLPSSLTSFVGRATERVALAAALDGSRLVTAVGPGGVGKTRLALAVAEDVSERFADGAWYVDLVPVTDGAMVAPAIAAALDLGEHARLAPDETVLAWLADREALLVLDNCEHVIDGVVPFVERMLSDCPGLVVLATSRARLVVPFERVFAVPGLTIDDGHGDAVELFIERAGDESSLRAPDQRDRVSTICQALDGSALAIELASARLPALGLDGLEAGLANPLRMLTGGPRADDRHRSVRATLDWSYALLDPEQQAVLRRTSVFAAPFTAGAASRVAATELVGAADVAEALAHLAEKSLLSVVRRPTGTRYRMLETIRQYGFERLVEASEQDEVRQRHMHWCIATSSELTRVRSDEPSAWRASFDDVADDLRAAIGWAAGRDWARREGFELAMRLGEMLFARGKPSEAQRRFEQAASLVDGADQVTALGLAADMAHCRMVGAEMARLRLAAADAAERFGDRATAAFYLARWVEMLGRFPGLMSEPIPAGDVVDAILRRAAELAGDDPRALAALQLARRFNETEVGPDAPTLSKQALMAVQATGDPLLESAALDLVTALHLSRGETAHAYACASGRLELLTGLPQTVHVGGELYDAVHMAAITSVAVGDLASTRRFAIQRSQLPFFREEGDLAVDWLIVWAAVAGELQEAVWLGDRFRAGWERAGRPTIGGMGVAPYSMALVHGLRGNASARAEWLEVHGVFRRTVVAAGLVESPTRGTFYAAWFDALLLLHEGDIAGALAALDQDPESLQGWNAAGWRQWYTALWLEAAVLGESPDAPERARRAAVIVEGNPIAEAITVRAQALLRRDATAVAAVAPALQAAACPYQSARSLVLAGGGHRDEGEAALAAMGAKPMVVPDVW